MTDWMIVAAVASALLTITFFIISGHAAVCLIKCEHDEGKGP
ncbi:MAG TPA: hypothetical protein VFG34_01210 [Sphingopyxis sp.]|nr:hypothetical protein [Sphingopyxis sp.]